MDEPKNSKCEKYDGGKPVQDKIHGSELSLFTLAETKETKMNKKEEEEQEEEEKNEI